MADLIPPHPVTSWRTAVMAFPCNTDLLDYLQTLWCGPRGSIDGTQHILEPSTAADPSADAAAIEPLHTADRLGNYMLGKTLGEGAFAKVKAATHIPTGQRVAIKFIYKSKIKEEYVWRNLYREARLLKLLHHPHIITLFEVIETAQAYCLVTDIAEGGEVLDYIVAHGKLQEKETRKFVRQLVSAVEHMHRASIVHRCVDGGAAMRQDH